MRHLILLPALVVLIAAPARGETGADVLLNQFVAPLPKGTQVSPEQQNQKSQLVKSAPKPKKQVILRYHRPNDFYQEHLLSTLRKNDDLSYGIKVWVQTILREDYAEALMSWDLVRAETSDAFRPMAQATQLYLLWKQGLNQTFFDQWLAMRDTNQLDLGAAHELEAMMLRNFDHWLISSSIVLSEEQIEKIRALPPNEGLVQTLQAYTDLRNQEKAERILKSLEAHNEMSFPLAQTALYARLKKNDLAGAAMLLKNQMEPAVDASQNLELQAEQELDIARILYQSGRLQLAKEFYLKIPRHSKSFVAAREELAWVYLRLGDNMNLRGELKTLSSAAFKGRFQPEVPMLKGISDLKLCLYNDVEKDLRDFQASNKEWAKKIDSATTAHIVPVPAEPDFFTDLANRASNNLQFERGTLERLPEGPARTEYLDQNKKDYALSQKHRVDEYLRQWNSQSVALSEAIKKMRFVQVEYMSQVRQWQAKSIDTKRFLASNDPAARVVADASKPMNFPVASELWSDELFALRSAAQGRCFKGSGQ
jgi:hypothetical protein